jgi:hypothetical protein
VVLLMIVTGMVSGAAAGCAESCGAVLILAGASKLYRGVRGLPSSSAIRRALRLTKRRWRHAELAAGGVECAVGLIICTRLAPLPAGAAMAVLGAAFCVALGYTRAKGVPGGCGCVQWRATTVTGAQAVSWREIARGAVLSGAGAAQAVGAALGPVAVDPGWFGAGTAAGAAVLVLLSTSSPLRTPVCHRGFWRPARAALRELTGHAVFTAMAESAGPLGPVAGHRRTGCADEFWFPVAAETGAGRTVLFQVRHDRSGGTLAVRASVRDLPPHDYA